MSERKDYYAILGVDKDATPEQIRKQYLKLSKKYHPDTMAGKSEEEKKAAEEKFKEIAEAYDVLSDPDKKYKYEHGNFEYQGGEFDPFDMFAHFRDMTSEFGMGDFGNTQQVVKGKTKRVRIPLTLEEMYNGGKKKIKISRNVACSHCNGTGSKDGHLDVCPECGGYGMKNEVRRNGNMIFETNTVCNRCNGTGKIVTNPCSHCHGTGLSEEKTEVEINYPKGMIAGMTMTMDGMGDAPYHGDGEYGDLIVEFQLVKHKFFTVQRNNLILFQDIPILDAITGCNIEVDGIDGKKYSVKIPQLSEDGKQFRLNGKGMPILHRSGYGDLYVVIKYKMPKSLSKDEISTLEKLKESKNFK